MTAVGRTPCSTGRDHQGRLAGQRRLDPPGWVDSPRWEPGPLVMHRRPPPVVTESAAVDRLRRHGLSSCFFTDSVTGRGHLPYPRYDGDLGLTSPGDGSQDDP
jgi:hypothetical protein